MATLKYSGRSDDRGGPFAQRCWRILVVLLASELLLCSGYADLKLVRFVGVASQRKTQPIERRAKIAIVGEGYDGPVAKLVSKEAGLDRIDVEDELRQKRGRKTNRVRFSKAKELIESTVKDNFVLTGLPNVRSEVENFFRESDYIDKVFFLRSRSETTEVEATGNSQGVSSDERAFDERFVEISKDKPDVAALEIAKLLQGRVHATAVAFAQPTQEKTEAVLPFSDYGGIDDVRTVPSVPWYAAVAKPTKKKKKVNFRNVDKSRISSIPSVIVRRLAQREVSVADSELATYFGDLQIGRSTSKCLAGAGISTPTPIQTASMMRILNGENVMLHAETGSGKTLAFLIPLVERSSSSKSTALQVIIAVPTRELAVQVARETALLHGGDISSVHLVIDSKADVGLREVKAPIVVGTAKALSEQLNMLKPRPKDNVFQNLSCLVCDEIDRLVEAPGKYATKAELEQRTRHPRPVIHVIKSIMELKPSCQLVVCSATVGRQLRRELSKVLGLANFKDGPAIVRSAGDIESTLEQNRAVPIPNTIHHFYRATLLEDFESMIKLLVSALGDTSPLRPLVFIQPQQSVNLVVMRLLAAGYHAKPLHEAIGFGSGRTGPSGYAHTSQALAAHDELSLRYMSVEERRPVLVASSDSARGLHFENVDYVFIVGRVKGPDEYVHISGRTGRQGKEGNVVSIVNYKELKAMKSWETQLMITMEEI